jgi:hypothetical protein
VEAQPDGAHPWARGRVAGDQLQALLAHVRFVEQVLLVRDGEPAVGALVPAGAQLGDAALPAHLHRIGLGARGVHGVDTAAEEPEPRDAVCFAIRV